MNTLEQVLKAFKSKKKLHTPWTINIELKGVIGSNQEFDGEQLCQAVKNTIDTVKFPVDRLLFSSFCFQNLTIMKKLIPNAKFGLLLYEGTRAKPCYSNFRESLRYSYLPFFPILLKELPMGFIDYLHPETTSITIDNLDLIKNDFGINAWSINEKLTELFVNYHVKFSNYSQKIGIPYTLISDHVKEINQFLTDT